MPRAAACASAVFKHSDGLLATDRGEGIEPFIEAHTTLQVIEQAAHGQACAVKAGRAAHPFGIDPDEWIFGVRQQRAAGMAQR